MSSASPIWATARVSNLLFRHAFPLYVRLYDLYKHAADREIIAVMRRVVRPGDRVVEVGANVGFYAELLARLVGSTGCVHAFEPDADNFARLAARAQRCPQIRPVRAAVTDQPGSGALYLSPNLNVDHRTYRTDDARRTITVDAVSLDSYFADHPEPLHFVKLDIQGAELAALRGMTGVLSRSPDVTILTEIWPFVLDRFGGGTGAVVAILESLGFEVHRLTPGAPGLGERLTADTAIPERDRPDVYFDVLCTRPGARLIEAGTTDSARRPPRP